MKKALGRGGWVLVSVVFAVFAMGGCSGDDSPTQQGSTTGSGVFLDSAVEGLDFASGSQSGRTDANGTFTYAVGQTIAFKVGDIDVGSGNAKPIMTPLDLDPNAVSEMDDAVTNIARFLQTIDDDANPDNGVEITDAVHTAAAGMSANFFQDPFSFESDSNVQQVVDALTTATSAGTRQLVSATAAQDHLRQTIIGSLSGTYSGTYGPETGGEGSSPRPIAVSAGTGAWSFTVDSNGAISGTVTPTGSGPSSLTGTTDAGGYFEATAQGADIQLFGQIEYDFSQRRWEAGGRWYSLDYSTYGSFAGLKH